MSGFHQPPAAARGAAAFHIRHDPAARLRLFCLPYAGAGASLFHAWSRVLPHGIQVCPIQLPGRENRLREPAPTELASLVRDLAAAIAPALDLPFAIFGHSMGAAIAFELARHLRHRGAARPDHLLLAAFRAPHLPPSLPPLAALPRPVFLDAVQGRYGRFADEILNEPALLDLVIPILRADLAMIETYQCAGELPLDCPITVFGGANDRSVTMAELEEWRCHTVAAFEVVTVPGGHLFLKDARDELLGEIVRRLPGGSPSPVDSEEHVPR